LENKRKVIVDFPRSAFKSMNIVEEGGASSSRVKREHESKNLRAQKMMRGKVEPSTMLTMERVMPIMVQEARQITEIPQMITPQET
jgi:hypothetical protein